jgi:hypothetical protein
MTKPHIKRHLNAAAAGRRPAMSCWRCFGVGLVGYGNSPSSSYRSWRIQHDAELARRRAAGEP